MAIRQVITFRVRPGSGAAFMAGFKPIVERVRREPGCEQYELFVGADDPDTLVMLERWSDADALQAALTKNYTGPDEPSVEFLKLLDGKPLREKYEL